MDELYRGYCGLYVEQKEIVKERLIAAVVDSLDSLSDVVCGQLLSIAESYRHLNALTATQHNQELMHAQNIVQEAGRVFGQQLASTLTQGLNSLNILPSTVHSVAFNQPTADVSISGTQAQLNTSTNQSNEVNEDSDDEEMSVKSEINSEDECLSYSDSQPDVDVKEEPDEKETEMNQSDETVTVKDEVVSSSECESDSDSDEYESDTMQVKEEEQEEDEVRSNDNSNNQDSVPDGSFEEESENVSQQEGNGHAIDSPMVDSHENDNQQPSGKELLDEQENKTEAISEHGQAGPSIVSNTASIMTRRSARASTAKKVNYSKIVGNSLTDQQDPLTDTRKRKRPSSGNSNAPERSRVVPAPTVSAEETDNSEDEYDIESEAISFRVIVRRLNCRVPGCKKVFPSQVQLDGHLLTKHAIEKYACKVKDCPESYATRTELKTHRNTAHDNLDNDWPCGVCEVTSNSYHDLCTHINQYHEYGLFACSVDKCDFTGKTRIKVKSHQRNHRPAKYRCTYAGCTSSFKLKSYLTTHLRVHSKEKPFLCSQCHKAFAQKGDLTVHERMHSGFKPYICSWPHCDFTSNKQSHVIDHIRGVHFGLPKSLKKQRERGIIDNRDARVFLKKTPTNGN